MAERILLGLDVGGSVSEHFAAARTQQR